MPVDIGYDLGSDEFAAEKPLVGTFLVRIKRAELRDTQAGGKAYLVVFEVTDGDDDPDTGESPVGREIVEFLAFPHASMKPAGRRLCGQRLREFIEAIGEDYSQGAPEPDDLTDLELAIRTKVGSRDGEPTTDVKKHMSEEWYNARGVAE